MYPWENMFEITNRCRAVENQVYLVATNVVGEDQSFSYFGRSMAVDFNGEITSLSDAARKVLGVEWAAQGPIYWMYEGETLDDRRRRLESEK